MIALVHRLHLCGERREGLKWMMYWLYWTIFGASLVVVRLRLCLFGLCQGKHQLINLADPHVLTDQPIDQ